ncbi:MAG: sterol desaturase family protein [Deltaproteobacteria bacterium]|nr:sterol desaturase family protein [Deltaproteobacteria bacterium]
MRWLVFPALLAGASALLWGLQDAGVDLLLGTTLLWMVTVVVLVLLERLLPFERAWQLPDDQLANDFAHTLLGSALGSRMGAGVADVVAAGVVFGFASIGISAFTPAWPFPVQVVAAYVVVDFARYWQHRLQHRVGFLWETHKLHHDARRLIAIKAGRSHVLDRALQALCVVPVVVAGAGPEVLFWCVGLNSVIGLIGHANVDARLGVLGFVFVGPPQHRVHHSIAVEDHHANFGASLIVWDRWFGTFRASEARSVGLPEETPTRVLGQLAAPLNAWLGY